VGNFLYFDSWDESLPTQIEVSGLFLKRNEDGSMYIPEVNTRVAVAYACYKFILGRINQPQFGYNSLQLGEYKQEWSNGKKWVQARSKMPDAMMKAVIRRNWNALLS
jgi:hypothetical protein